MPYLNALINEYRGQPGSREHLEALNVATVARNGKLQGKHHWLAAPVNKWQATQDAGIESKAGVAGTSLRKKRVLMLGSGMVAGPAVKEICKSSDVEIIVGQCFIARTYYGYCINLFHENSSHASTDVTDS